MKRFLNLIYVSNFSIIVFLSLSTCSCNKLDINYPPIEKRQVADDLFTDVEYVILQNYGLSPDGDTYIQIGKYVTNWILGSGVYKIEKEDRDTEYNISYSIDGKPGTKVFSYQNCRNNYFVVPDDSPYFRLSFNSNRIRIKKVKEYEDGLINVFDFGAQGDGITDDTNAIQEAIEYASYGKGGSVYLPNGTFVLNTIHSFDNTCANLIIPYNKNTTPFLSEYSNNKVYFVGSRVLHDGEKYVCNSNNTTGEWNNTKWDKYNSQVAKTRINIVGNGRALSYKSFIDAYGSSIPPLHSGSFIKSLSTCDLNDGTESPVSVISCGYNKTSSFALNYNVIVELKGFTLKTDNSNGYSRLCGIDLSHCGLAFVEDIAIYSADLISEVYIEEAGYLQNSDHFSCGLMMPMLYCDPTTYAHNVTVSGSYTIGFMIGDCQEFENCWCGLCRYGYVQCSAGHPSVVGGHIFCFNTNNVISSAASVLYDSSLNKNPLWCANVHYKNGDIVFHNGLFWKCGNEHISTDSFNSSLWDYVCLFGSYNPLFGNLFINQVSVEPAKGLRPIAFNTNYIVFDPANTLRGSISYINADSPYTPLPIMGAKNVTVINLYDKGNLRN